MSDITDDLRWQCNALEVNGRGGEYLCEAADLIDELRADKRELVEGVKWLYTEYVAHDGRSVEGCANAAQVVRDLITKHGEES